MIVGWGEKRNRWSLLIHCHVHFPDYGLDTDRVVTTIDQGDQNVGHGLHALHDSKLGVEFGFKA